MKYLSAYMLLTIGGKAAPTAADVSAVLASVGIESDAARLDALIAELAGKSIDELIAEGSSKLASVPSSGGASSAAAPAASSGGAAAAVEKVEEKVEEKEESDDDLGFGLFD